MRGGRCVFGLGGIGDGEDVGIIIIFLPDDILFVMQVGVRQHRSIACGDDALRIIAEEG